MFDGINVANSGELVRMVAKAPMDDTYSDFVVEQNPCHDYHAYHIWMIHMIDMTDMILIAP